LIDLAGDQTIVKGVSEHAGDKLLRTVIVGVTHWEEREGAAIDPLPNSEMFFLPTWIEKRRTDWGPTRFLELSDEAFAAFQPTTDAWLRIEEHSGVDEISSVYSDVVAGKNPPDIGFVLQFEG
jgi:hypothetical protein